MEKNQHNKQFDFGQNWKEFSTQKLSKEMVGQAKMGFKLLVEGLELQNKTFIDIGFGQGLGLLTATEMGAKTLGVDINPKCKETLEINKTFFKELAEIEIPVIVGSILSDEVLEKVTKINKKYDIVHSWGVLHHTGNMWKAIDNSCDLLKPKGKFIIAIYNKHWSSGIWQIIKKTYNFSPSFIKKLMVYLFSGIIFMAKFLVTFKNPLNKERGMSFYYDVVDWVGGYPYEYASKAEIVNYMHKKRFRLLKFTTAEVPTGCHEYIFEAP